MMNRVVDHIALQAQLQPEQLAAVDLTHGGRWSYAALDRAVSGSAWHLTQALGCRPGDRVACLSKNRVEMVILHHACARAGLIFVPLNWRLASAELAVLLADAAPVVVFGGQEELAQHGVSGLQFDDFDWRAPAASALAAAPIDPDRPSLILYTSGTSGRPKGVMLTERNLAQTAINFALLGKMTPSSAFLIDAPMFHVIGLVTSVRPTLMLGGTVLVSDGFVPARTLSRIADPSLAISHYFCVPQMAGALRREPSLTREGLSSLTAIFTGGAPHPADDIKAWLGKGVLVCDGFGMSEAGTVFGMPAALPLILAKAGSVGIPTPAIQTRICRPDGSLCASNEPGELQLKGDNIFVGYWNRPDETKAAFTPDGWFWTGDIATCDDEGYYRIVDRKKDMFISGGENIYPAEIEAALADMPGLRECAVVGMSDAQWGEVGVLCYVPVEGSDLDEASLLARLSDRIARYKLPKRFVKLDALPRTGSGKVLKAPLKTLIER